MSAATPVTIVGSTGLTGSSALKHLLASPVSFAVTALTRRAAPAETSANSYNNRVLPDLAAATTDAEPLASTGSVYVSCLGSTRADSGGVDKQREIDLVLNRDLAQRARKDGATTMILVSSTGANAKSWFAYPAMKGQLEDDVKAMGFTSTVILRPGMLLYPDGGRPTARGGLEPVLVKTLHCLGSWGVPIGSVGIEGDDIGAAIAQLAANPPAGVSYLYNADISKLAAEYRASLAPK